MSLQIRIKVLADISFNFPACERVRRRLVSGKSFRMEARLQDMTACDKIHLSTQRP